MTNSFSCRPSRVERCGPFALRIQSWLESQAFPPLPPPYLHRSRLAQYARFAHCNCPNWQHGTQLVYMCNHHNCSHIFQSFHTLGPSLALPRKRLLRMDPSARLSRAAAKFAGLRPYTGEYHHRQILHGCMSRKSRCGQTGWCTERH